ncbi:MAG: hypothetical protein ABIG32_00390 [Candidatus Uhrbacteria bacterium]|nr:hypothetical protein [Patescibacteria group bacterium]MBU1907343.1 hypothetical protein [Patescibacteria group bacterium]
MSKLTKGAGDLARESWSHLVRDFATYGRIISYVVIAVIVMLIGYGIIAVSLEELSIVIFGGIVAFVGTVALIILAFWSQISLIEAADHSAARRKYRLRHIFDGRLWLYVVHTIVAASFFGLVVLFGMQMIIPGLMLAVWLAFFKYAVVLDDKTDVQALLASYKIVRGRFWPTLWRLFAFGLVLNVAIWVSLALVFGLSYGIGAFMAAGSAEILAALLMIVFYLAVVYLLIPFATLYMVLLYRDLKKTA